MRSNRNALEDLYLTCRLVALINVIRVRFQRFQRHHLDRCADVQPRSNREPPLEFFGRVLGVLAVGLDGVQEQILLDSFDSDRPDLSKLPVELIQTDGIECFWLRVALHHCVQGIS